MQAKDFRIGNYLQDRQERLCKVERIEVDGILAPAIVGGQTSLPVKPILLTEDLLLKLGWIWNIEANSFENNDVRMNLKYESISGSYTMYNYIIKALIAKRIFYVHQLQNLYFALTGMELNTGALAL